MPNPFDCCRIRIEQGELIGKMWDRPSKKTPCGKFYGFQGIPYAKAPLGMLRFCPPQPPPKWETPRDATKEGQMCCQEGHDGSLVGSEDCLYLNVYTPATRVRRLLPVMVWFHDGGFSTGSGNKDLFGPDYIVNENVLLVTFNFRLGPFGYLSLDTPEISGNLGSKDQIAALKWIQGNIKSFGGNPQNVTIFGSSSGASMVHALMYSSLAKGLFHRAILQSGSLLNDWAFTDTPSVRAQALAKTLGIETMDPRELAHFLRTVPAMELVHASSGILCGNEKISTLPNPFGMVSERETIYNDMFLTRKPAKLVQMSKITQVPVMIGFNEHEGLGFLKDAMNDIRFLEANFEQLVPKSYGLPIKSPKSKQIADKIKYFYFGGKSIRTAIPELIDLLSDLHIIRGVHGTVKTHVKLLPSMFYYKFNFEGDLNLSKKASGAQQIRGVSHGDEIFYLFKTDLYGIKIEEGSREQLVKNRMVKMWTNFAKCGNPTPLTKEYEMPTWDAVDPEKMNYMDIGATMKMEEKPLNERMKFWSDMQKLSMDTKLRRFARKYN